MKMHLDLGRQCCVCPWVSVVTCQEGDRWLCCMWQGGVCGCALGGRRGRRRPLKMESSGKQSEVARAGNLSSEGAWQLSQWIYRSTEEQRGIGSGGELGHCWVGAGHLWLGW